MKPMKPDGLPGLDPSPVLDLINGQPATVVSGRLGVHRTLISHWRAGRRGIGRERAERIAVELGRHPANLWPGEW